MSLNRRSFLKLAGIGAGSLAGAAAAPPPAKASTSAVDASQHPSMLYDTTLCVGCRACQTACRNWNETSTVRDPQGLYDAPDDLSADTWTVIKLHVDQDAPAPAADRSNWSFIKRNCMHCIDPACVSACTVGALQKDPAGPVTYDLDVCFGCRYCMVACPYHIPRYQWDTTVPLVQKCTFCFGYAAKSGETHPKNRLAQGRGPSCVEACPAGALTWGTRQQMLDEAHARIAAQPGKYYENRVYGEHEGGGTLQLILSHVPFTDLGLPTLDPRPLPDRTAPANRAVPFVVVGVGALATAIYGIRGRAEKQGAVGEGSS